MQYRFTTPAQNYSLYASGQVLYSAPKHPAFPVRLGSEIFQQALVLWQAEGGSGPCTLYDPCCGSAYTLTVLAYLHWPQLKALIGSDISPSTLALAQRNLGLLTPAGLQARLIELEAMQAKYGKDSHKQAITSIKLLQNTLHEHLAQQALPSQVFQADITNEPDLAAKLAPHAIDVILTDVPYGQFTHWGSTPSPEPKQGITAMLETLTPLLQVSSIVAITTNKGQAIRHPAYKCLKRLKVGKRQVAFLKLALKDSVTV